MRRDMLFRRIARGMLGGLMCLALKGQQPAKTLRQVDTEVIEMNRFGFVPKQVTRPHGAHFIYVRNTTGLRNLSLQLTRAGAIQKQLNVTVTTPHWRELLDLTPGVYLLVEPSHPTWLCTITILP